MKTVLKNGTLIDGTGMAPKFNISVLIKDSKIIDIGPDIPIPSKAELIDAKGKTLIPGLIDAHLHLMGVRSMQPIQWMIDSPALKAARGVEDTNRLIQAGFTTVRCAGSEVSLSIKKAVNEGTILGPRIIAANKVITQTAGHGDMHELPLEWVTSSGSHMRIADGKDDCRKAAREQIRAGADVIKICSTGGVMSEKDSPFHTQFVDEEIAAITTEAHRVGIKVMSHAQSPEGIQIAIQNGVDSIEHAIYLDDETISLMLDQETTVVPTLAIANALFTKGKEAGAPDYALKKLKEVYEIHVESIKKAFKAGVKIALGTDFVGPEILRHGENAIELALLVDQVGMSPMQALMAATKIGAETLGIEQEIGTIETGKKADILLIDGDPLSNIELLQDKKNILLVMKEGKVVIDRR